jgi:hypothetical protein
MSLEHISLERIEEIEQEREQTQLDPEFQSWMKQLNIGRLCINRDGIVRANQMMQEWKMNLLSKTY